MNTINASTMAVMIEALGEAIAVMKAEHFDAGTRGSLTWVQKTLLAAAVTGIAVETVDATRVVKMVPANPAAPQMAEAA